MFYLKPYWNIFWVHVMLCRKAMDADVAGTVCIANLGGGERCPVVCTSFGWYDDVMKKILSGKAVKHTQLP